MTHWTRQAPLGSALSTGICDASDCDSVENADRTKVKSEKKSIVVYDERDVSQGGSLEAKTTGVDRMWR
jgi:hypothetical protein